MPIRITADDLRELGACESGVLWFATAYPKGATPDDMLSATSLGNSQAEWLLEQLAPSQITREYWSQSNHLAWAYWSHTTDTETHRQQRATLLQDAFWAVWPYGEIEHLEDTP